MLYHSMVGLLVEREKIVNLQHLQREHMKDALIVMHDKIITHSNNKLSHCCLISAHGHFIIPTNRVLGKSAYQCVLEQLQMDKQ